MKTPSTSEPVLTPFPSLSFSTHSLKWVLPMLGLLLAGCGSTESFFTLRMIGSEPVGGLSPITLDAVDEIRVSIDPPENIEFMARPQQVFEDSTVTSFVSSAGEFVVSLSREYIQTHATRNETGFTIDLSMSMEAEMVGDLADPGLFVEFIQRNADGTETLGAFRRAVSWPLVDDEIETVTLACAPGLEAKCLNMRP